MKIRYLNRSIYIIYICRRLTICKNTSLAMPPAIRKISFIFTIKRRFESDIHHTPFVEILVAAFTINTLKVIPMLLPQSLIVADSDGIATYTFGYSENHSLHVGIFMLWVCFRVSNFCLQIPIMIPCAWCVLPRDDFLQLRRWFDSCTEICLQKVSYIPGKMFLRPNLRLSTGFV